MRAKLLTFFFIFDILKVNQIHYFLNFFTGEITMIYAYAINVIIICAIVLSIRMEKDSVKSHVMDCRK